MTENPYQVLGVSVPSMLGRAELVRRIEGHLLKPSPDHVSVVGPAHYGKSVLLQYLADAHREGSSKYLTTVHIDLRRDTPTSDGAFKRRLAEELKAALQPYRSDLSELLALDDEGTHELMVLVFDDLESSGVRILVVLDGFDYVLAGHGLTRNLWDQLRSLAQKTSLRFVTGSRRPLRELCRTEESRTSDFWEIFYDTPIRVAALDDADWAPFLEPLLAAGCTLDEPARKEIINWTGGVPLLVCALLQRLWEQARESPLLTKPDIDRAAETVLNERHELLATLWDDCDVELRADLGALADTDGILRAELSDSRLLAIRSRGYGRESKNRLRGSCRLIQRYAVRQLPALADLTRLFGTAQGFDSNIRSLLELRFAQIDVAGVDREFRESVSNTIRDLTPYPNSALTWMRRIANRVLTLIWEAELPPDKTLPAEWIDEWRNAGVRNLPEDRGKLPRGSGTQCNVLRLITGTERTPRQSRYATKPTYLLVDHLQSVGDFGQHQEDYPEATISTGVVTAFVLAAISLVESLTSDLHEMRSQGSASDISDEGA